MNIFVSQRGVGLVEVLVAVLLLSVAVLGFSALQVRAVSATDESLVRTKSLTLVRNLAEVMRAYPEAYVTGSDASFANAQPNDTGAVPTVQAIVTSTALTSASAASSVTVGTKSISIDGADNCLSLTTKSEDSKEVPAQACDINQLAARDTLLVKKLALEEDIKLAVVTCPGTTVAAIQQQMCVITAWNDTEAAMDDANAKACANVDGIYKTGSHCLISEAY